MRRHFSLVPTTAVFLGLALAVTGCSPIESPSGGGNGASRGPDLRPVKPGGELRVALSAEPDLLDPTLARTLVGRTVFNAICEKLYDVDQSLNIVPQLASALPVFSEDNTTATIKIRTGLKFADGTTMDAAAVKASLDRHKNLSGSARTSELSSVDTVEVVDPATVLLRLKTPFAPLSAVLADRAGMVMTPAAVTAAADKFAQNPVCIGPFKFSSRIAQDRIEVVKDPNYYNAANVKLDKVIYRIIADGTTRFNNLRSGDVEVLDAVNATDVDALKADTNLTLLTSDSLGYQGITINVGNVNGVGKPAGRLAAPFAGPMATSNKVRQAFELSLDRDAINKAVFRGQFTPACGPISPTSPLSSEIAQKCPVHDPAAAKAMLTAAGVAAPVRVSMVIGNTPQARLLGEAIQAQAREGGFEIQLQPTEFSASLDATDAGKYQMFQIGWSGRVDPDGNIANFLQTNGSQNISGYANPLVDRTIDRGRASGDIPSRKQLYGDLVTKIHEDAPIIYLYRQ